MTDRLIWLGLLCLTLLGCRAEASRSQLGNLQTIEAAATRPLLFVSPEPSEPGPRLSGQTPVWPSATPTGQITREAGVPPSITPSHTPTPFASENSIGVSIGGRALRHYQLGHGAQQIVFIGALHGGHECNTRWVLEAVQERLLAEPELVPATVTVHILPAINIDGCLLDTRENARIVDLNRNWDTPDWQPDSYGPFGFLEGGGGDVPFSEPETFHLKNWLLALQDSHDEQDIWIVSYHSAVPPTGLVLPAYLADGQSAEAAHALARFYAAAAGYRFSEVWVGGYRITGELAFWLGVNGFVGIDVELPDRQGAEAVPAGFTTSHIETNWQAILALLELAQTQPNLDDDL